MSAGLAQQQQQMMWNDGYGSAPVGLAAWVDAHAFPVPPPQENDNEAGHVESHGNGGGTVMRKVAALEVENCEMAGKMAGMEALLREREMEASDMKQQLMAYEHVLEGERRGEPLSKAELLKQVIALSAQLNELNRLKAAAPPPPVVGPTEDSASAALAPLPPPPGSAVAPQPASNSPQKPAAAAAQPAPAPKAPEQAAPAPAPAPAAAAPRALPALEAPPQAQSAVQYQSAAKAEADMQLALPAPPPVRLGKNSEPQSLAPAYQPPPQMQQQQQQQQMMMQQQYQQQQQQQQGQWGGNPQDNHMYHSQSMPRPGSRGLEYRIPASPRTGGMNMGGMGMGMGMGGMVPASPRVGGMGMGGMVPASPRVAMQFGQPQQQRMAVPASPRIAYNRVPQSPRTAAAGMGGMVPASPRVGASPFAPQGGGGGYYAQERPMTSPSPLLNRSASAGLGSQAQAAYGQTVPMGHSASFGGSSMAQSFGTQMTHSASYGGNNPMTPSGASVAPSAFAGTNVTNMNAAEMYGGDITASGLSAVRGSLLTFQRAKNLQAKESVLRHLDQMVEHGRVSPDEVVAGVMEKCTERMRMVPPPPRPAGGILANLAGKAKLKAGEDEFLKNAAVAEVGMLSSTVVAFEWAPSTCYLELIETVPDLITRRLLTLEFLNGIFGRCGKLAVAKVINELSCLDSIISDGVLPSVRELSNCMVLVMVNTKRSVEWRRKWVLGKA